VSTRDIVEGSRRDIIRLALPDKGIVFEKILSLGAVDGGLVAKDTTSLISLFRISVSSLFGKKNWKGNAVPWSLTQ
jgi:hypothetical protein